VTFKFIRWTVYVIVGIFAAIMICIIASVIT